MPVHLGHSELRSSGSGRQELLLVATSCFGNLHLFGAPAGYLGLLKIVVFLLVPTLHLFLVHCEKDCNKILCIFNGEARVSPVLSRGELIHPTDLLSQHSSAYRHA